MGGVSTRRIEAGEIDLLEPLWAALHEHHAPLADMPPVREVEESWRIRRETYRGWLAEGETVILVAWTDDENSLAGYATVRTGPGAATWKMGERVAELETLSVLPDARGSGVGKALVAAAREAAAEGGAETRVVAVAHSNDSALGFYEAAGFKPFYVDLTIPTGAAE